MYYAIKLDSEEAKNYEYKLPPKHNTRKEKDAIYDLSKINIFIGPNNSGKSRLLRDFFQNLDKLYDNSKMYLSDEFNDINNFIVELYKITEAKDLTISDFQISDFRPPTFWSFKKIDEYKNLTFRYDVHIKYGISEGKLHLMGIKDGTRRENIIINVSKNSDFEKFTRLNDLLTEIDIDNSYKIENSNYLYIPILRSLRNINEFKDTYKEVTKKDYFDKKGLKDDKQLIFTGLSLFNDLKDKLLGNLKGRNDVKDFEIFLSQNFLNSKKITLIPNEKEKNVYVHIEGQDRDLPIYLLGDGVQSIIILTYPLFFRKGETLKVYIEEPDVHLHPGYQRILLETLLKTEGFEDFQYFFTTHSNHFLDMTLDYKDISVYKFEKKEEEKFEITNIDNPDTTILEHIGARNSSMFLTNCTIWIEGISDRIYIREYLRLYQDFLINQKSEDKTILFKEDIHYSFFEYGGANIVHYSFLEDETNLIKNINFKRLCGEVILIADNDNAKGKKRERLDSLIKNLGKNFIELDCKEIENTLTPKIILGTLRSIEKNKNLEFKNTNPTLSKKGNIANFINKNIELSTLKTKSKYLSSDNENLVNKAFFAQSVAKIIQSKEKESKIKFDDLSEEAQKITKLIYNFIQKKNS